MTLFEAEDPVQYLKWRLENWPSNKHGVKSALAKELGVHSSLISQILNEQKLLSPEMAIPLSRFLGLNELSSRYLLALIQESRAGTQELKDYYQKERQKIRERSDKIANRMQHKKELAAEDKSLFYSQWYYSAIHLALYSDDVNSTQDISDKLDIPHHLVQRVLPDLRRMGLCKKEDEGFYKPLDVSSHIPESYPLVNRHHMNWRIEMIRWLDRIHPDDFFFTGPVTLRKKDQQSFRRRLLGLVEEYSRLISDGEGSDLCLLNVDFKVYR